MRTSEELELLELELLELSVLEALDEAELADDVADAAASVTLELSLELEVELASCRGARAAALAVEARTAAKRAEAVSENFMMIEVLCADVEANLRKRCCLKNIYTCRPPPALAHANPCLNSHRGVHCSAACAVPSFRVPAQCSAFARRVARRNVAEPRRNHRAVWRSKGTPRGLAPYAEKLTGAEPPIGAEACTAASLDPDCRSYVLLVQCVSPLGFDLDTFLRPGDRLQAITTSASVHKPG